MDIDIQDNNDNINNNVNDKDNNKDGDQADDEGSEASILDEDRNELDNLNNINNDDNNFLFDTNANNNLIENKMESDFFNLKNGNFFDYINKFGDGNKQLLKSTNDNFSNFFNSLNNNSKRLNIVSNNSEDANKTNKIKKEHKLFDFNEKVNYTSSYHNLLF